MIHMQTFDSFPSTRFQGSKRDLADWIWDKISELDFDSAIDPFGGTGAISYKFKTNNIKTYYNDYLRFNYHIGRALIENDSEVLTIEDIEFLLTEHSEYEYPTFIQDEFEGLYYTDEENAWLDRMHINIKKLNNKYKQSLAYAILAQSALAKRPYNLFHRANLYMRTEDVERSFGNKTTWDKSFEEHFREKVSEFNKAVFDNNRVNKSYNKNILQWENPPETDLAYIDSPYLDDTKSNSKTDYQFYYHFLEGFLQYEKWEDQIDRSVKTKRLEHTPSAWTQRDKITEAFREVFQKFNDRIIVVSYNTAGYPTPQKLKQMLEEQKDTVSVYAKDYQYALSKKENSADEILLVAHNT